MIWECKDRVCFEFPKFFQINLFVFGTVLGAFRNINIGCAFVAVFVQVVTAAQNECEDAKNL